MKVFTTVTISVLSAAMIALAIFLPVKNYDKKEEKQFEILTLWHIDAFEGGTGSRASYLKKVCAGFERENDCLITVVNETAGDALEKIGKGIYPDILSYSRGLDGVFGICKEIDFYPFSGGGEYNGKHYAAAWAYGGYVEITRKGVTPQKTIISKGKYSHPEIACLCSGINIDGAESDLPQRAYETFLSDESYKLIGTQRDIYRLKKKTENFDIRPIGGFTDLVQYVSVTSKDDKKSKTAKRFINYLLTEGQKDINALGLISVDKNRNIADNGLIDRLFDVEYTYTLSVFTSEDVIGRAESELNRNASGERENTEFLKSITKLLK